MEGPISGLDCQYSARKEIKLSRESYLDPRIPTVLCETRSAGVHARSMLETVARLSREKRLEFCGL